jgi:hypothetical protein
LSSLLWMHDGNQGSIMMIMVSLSLHLCHWVPRHNSVLMLRHLCHLSLLPLPSLHGCTPRCVPFSTHLDPTIQGSRRSTMMPNLVELAFLMAPFSHRFALLYFPEGT